ncbi:unnamed protein product [Albugo candida]|uniref:Uncharacterized protein n=1 Tax=Albugo candida TaxID=65357 RepID=A0A024GDE9_9STRA|nr:unnamed protein product [Albugo candida]|eukprot:CCI44353.1 unnamed protein product [Albugo candida]
MWSYRYHAIQSAFRRPYSTKTTLSYRIFKDDRNASNLDQSKYNTAFILHGILAMYAENIRCIMAF